MSDCADETSDRDRTSGRVSQWIDPFSPKSDAAVALEKVSMFSHSELVGETLLAGKLSPPEGAELRAL